MLLHITILISRQSQLVLQEELKPQKTDRIYWTMAGRGYNTTDWNCGFFIIDLFVRQKCPMIKINYNQSSNFSFTNLLHSPHRRWGASRYQMKIKIFQRFGIPEEPNLQTKSLLPSIKDVIVDENITTWWKYKFFEQITKYKS